MKPSGAQNFRPRLYQHNVLRAFSCGEVKRGVCVWHRRAGKDKDGFNLMVFAANPRPKPAPIQRVGNYLYVFPTYRQGKKALWDNIDGDGFRTINHAPARMVEKRNESEMKITFRSGSTIQIMGGEDPDSLRGPNPVGVIFSEYSAMNPQAWNVIRPILRENRGWALFLYTPLGRNHGKHLYDMAAENPDWYCELLTVRDTKRDDGSPVLTEADIEAERREGMPEEMVQQEYFCSWSGMMVGSYYAALIETARQEGRIGKVPHDSALPVQTVWDLGVGDSTAIWFVQQAGREVRMIDYYENSGEGMAHYAKVLQDKPYIYGTHYAPHDAQARMMDEKARTRVDVAKSLGVEFKVLPRLKVEDGIEASRNMLGRTWFDEEKCEAGISALEHYHREYDEKRREFQKKPYHDWSSHGADGFRYAAMGLPGIPKPKDRQATARARPTGTHGWMQ